MTPIGSRSSKEASIIECLRKKDKDQLDVDIDAFPKEFLDPVTFQPMTTCIILTECNHRFHVTTIAELLIRDRQIKCPLCRRVIDNKKEGWRKVDQEISDKCIEIFNKVKKRVV